MAFGLTAGSFKKKVKESDVRTLVNLILLLASSTLVIFNSVIARSWMVGVPASFVLLYVGSVAAGKLFYSEEGSFIRGILGFATFALLMALSGVVPILLGIFSEMLSVIIVVVITVILYSGSILSGNSKTPKASENKTHAERYVTNFRSYSLGNKVHG